MTYWLSPVPSTDPFTIGQERFLLDEKTALHLRNAFVKLQPFFLPFLKTHILPEGDNELVCGVDYFSLEGDGPIVFDGNPLQLSKCGGAFLQKLPTIKEINQKRLAFKEQLKQFEIEFSPLMPIIEEWWDKEWIVVIFKE